jgi:tRNA dimethylallyltransferase
MTSIVNDSQLVVVILGPTATGKSELAVELALRFGGEIVSADSRQVYRHMDIGTAKPTLEQQALVPHHLIDVVDPDEDYDVARYQREALEAIKAVPARGKLPFLVGGSGLYLAAAMGELDLPIVGADAELRRRLEKEAAEQGGEALHQRLAEVDPETAARLHPNDLQRVIRALEVHYLTGLPLSAFRREKGAARHCEPSPVRFLRIGLTAPREALYRRIEQRVEKMMAQGFLDEVSALLARGYHLGLKSMDSLGYKELGAHLEGRMELDEAVETFKRNTRRFAKRQLTWFRKTPEVNWFDITADSFVPDIRQEIESRLGKP